MEYRVMEIEAFDATIEATEDGHYQGKFKVRVLRSPAGEMSLDQATIVEYDDDALQSRVQALVDRNLDHKGLVELGRLLGILILPPASQHSGPSIREQFRDSLNIIGEDCSLQLRLRLPLALAVLPWEYIYADRAGGGDGMDGFIALNPRIAIVRHEVLDAPTRTSLVKGDIKVVAALASNASARLDIAKEKHYLEEALGARKGLAAIFLEKATLSAVHDSITGVGVFHFAGHGIFNRAMSDLPGTYTGRGALALQDQNVDAEQLGILLQSKGIRLAVLGGCETGRRDGINVWSGVAPALVKAEIPAVVANQFPIRDTNAIAFSRGFYRALVGGRTIEEAVADGRLAIYLNDRDDRDWGVPVLYMRADDGRLFEGAADPQVREEARTESVAEVSIRVREVEKGGLLLATEVEEMHSGRIEIKVKVDEEAGGEVWGGHTGEMSGGTQKADLTADKVGDGATLGGLKFKHFGSRRENRSRGVKPPTHEVDPLAFEDDADK